jgi:hypothetical protein
VELVELQIHVVTVINLDTLKIVASRNMALQKRTTTNQDLLGSQLLLRLLLLLLLFLMFPPLLVSLPSWIQPMILHLQLVTMLFKDQPQLHPAQLTTTPT